MRQIRVSIDRLPSEVYEFASNLENLPQWATGLGGSIKNVNGEWVADMTDQKFAVDARWVEKDLNTLKALLESQQRGNE